MNKDKLADYILDLVKPLLAAPDELSITSTSDDMGILYTLNINRGDFGKVIGREGSNINAIRLLVRNVGMIHGIRASIKIPDKQI